MRHDTVYTSHMIDDICLTADEAMDAFRKHFPLTGCNVFANGKIMNYRLKHPRNARSWEKVAKQIIDQNNLPLEANLEQWERGSVVFEVNLCIEYKPN